MKKEIRPTLNKKELIKGIIQALGITTGYLSITTIINVLIGMYFNTINFVKDMIFINGVTIIFSLLVIILLKFKLNKLLN
ncbi:hypothetical protein [Clostridium botulinum]|uniref:hypothetical protein n=1 Tax=Clostridium botulinum TaxID=1491 RepID=UPI001C9A9DFA|nr:hypothetical protein [Clostridium botulinum]MBY6838667.1 hypothetical protein [Clostridium botulinum]